MAAQGLDRAVDFVPIFDRLEQEETALRQVEGTATRALRRAEAIACQYRDRKTVKAPMIIATRKARPPETRKIESRQIAAL